MLKAGKHKYTERERLMFHMIADAAPGRVTTRQLTKSDKHSHSFFRLQSVMVGLVGLKRKLDANKEDWVLCRTDRAGPNPIEWWVERRYPYGEDL
jgi:hypothetical protein